jgi:hypothetical protein
VKLLATFETIGAALDFEKAMKNRSSPVEIMPTPRCLGVACSYSALIECQEGGAAADALPDALRTHSKLYRIVMNAKGREVYEPCDGEEKT